jgi:serine protease Do
MIHSRLLLAVVVSIAGPSAPREREAQDRANPARDDAVLVVDGVVREVFSSARRDRVDSIIQIEVKRSEAVRSPRIASRVPVPAPGDMVYVHTSQRPSAALGLQGQDAPQTTQREAVALAAPAERSQVRVYLAARSSGGWEGAGSPWFELTSRELAEAAPADPSPPAIERAPGELGPRPVPKPGSTGAARSALISLGLTGEGMNAQGKFVLRVLSVEPNGPSKRAGLEPGDIIIGLNDKPLTGVEELDALTHQGGRFNLVLLDVNTGKTVRVPIEVAPPGRAGAPGRVPLPGEKPDTPAIAGDVPNSVPRAPGRSLGVSAETVTVGQRTAMKVVAVQPDSPGQKAGLEPGDVIVAANGVPITGAEALSAVVRKSGPTLTLTVRDIRNGKDTPVEVKLGGEEPGSVTSSPATPSAPTGAGRRLGAVTELAFYDVDPAVKVTEVEPGGAAAQAGIEAGDVIIEANGSPVMHPKELDEAVRKSGPTLKLMVVGAGSRQKTAVLVKLGAQR